MIRTCLLLAALAAAQPAAGWAEMITLDADLGIEPAAEARPDPVVRGRVLGHASDLYDGFTAATVPRPERAGDLDLSLGIRPRVWNGTLDLGYTRRLETPCCGDVAPGLDQRAGPGSFGARVYFDSASDNAGAEARAAIEVVRGARIAGGIRAQDALDEPPIGVDAGLQQVLADRCTVDPRYRDANLAPAHAGANRQRGF